MLAGIDLAMCPNLAVPAEVMRHVVQVESSANPFAIGVVGGQLQRQPRSLAEAVATVRMLESEGYDYSLGIAQVNRRNLGRYGLGTYVKAFNTCANLQAGASILSDCYARAGYDWGKAFSCYYSGNFLTGYRDGYVQRIFTSMRGRTTPVTGRASTIPPSSEARQADTLPVRPGFDASYRIAIRSVALDTATRMALRGLTQNADSTRTEHGASDSTDTSALVSTRSTRSESVPAVGGDGAFHPIVRGPNDASASTNGTPTARSAYVDRENRSQEHADAAFVF